MLTKWSYLATKKYSAAMCNIPIRDNGSLIICVTIGCTVVAIVAVLVRIFGRLMHRERKLMLDDYAIVITTVSHWPI